MVEHVYGFAHSTNEVALPATEPKVPLRDDAGRFKSTKLKLAEARDVVAAAAAIYELVGQSSVSLSLDSKGAIKPEVKCYHRDVHEAARLAQEVFDEQLLKYVFKPVAGVAEKT